MLASLTTPIGKIFQPLLDFVGSVLAFFFSIIPNYPVDVALLTIVIMAALTPLTVKSTKGMAAMQALAPEMKKLQQKYKGGDRTQMNEEMMKLYKEHNVNPASGCLPMLLMMPAFLVLYGVIRGITNTVTIPAHTTVKDGLKVYHPEQVIAEPRYLPNPSKMRTDIVAAHGQLNSFGMNFADKLLAHHSSIWIAIPYLLLVAGAVGLQYLQMSRLNARNPQAAQANPQAAMMQKYMPLIFGFIYLNVAAILNVYFIISSAIRILTQEILFRRGIVPGSRPVETTIPGTKKSPGKPSGQSSGAKSPTKERREIEATAVEATAAKKTVAKKTDTAPSRTRRQSTTASTRGTKSGGSATTSNGATSPGNGRRSGGSPTGRTAPSSRRAGQNGNRTGTSRGATSNGSNGNGKEAEATSSKDHPRSKAKRERKAR
jgi:YidC/Oxa1 family membrane protein insertase